MKYPEFKESYIEYVGAVLGKLADQRFYKYFINCLNSGRTEIHANNLKKLKTIDLDWIEKIEASIIPLDTIIRNPRRFIIQEEDIVPISLAKKITQESIRHLAQHTQLIQEVRDDNVVPDKILNVSKEESYEIYENRFIYTLIVNTYNFIVRRLDQIEKDVKTSNIHQLNFNTVFQVEEKRLNFSLSMESSSSVGSLIKENPEEMTLIERIVRLKKIFDDFISSSFGKQMAHSAMVRPPIQRTNVILKDPNFQNALGLWGFVETYNKLGYSMNVVESVGIVEQEYVDQLTHSIFLDYVLFKEYIEHDVYRPTTERTTKVEPRFVKELLKRIIEPDDILVVESSEQLKQEKQKVDSTRIKAINKVIDRALDNYNKLKIEQAQEQERLRLIREARLEKARLERIARAHEKKLKLEVERELKRIAKEAALAKKKEEDKIEKARLSKIKDQEKKEKAKLLAKLKAQKERERKLALLKAEKEKNKQKNKKNQIKK